MKRSGRSILSMLIVISILLEFCILPGPMVKKAEAASFLTNVALGKKVINTDENMYNTNLITDGSANDSSQYSDIGTGNRSIIIDLEKIYDVKNIKLWHYFRDNRYYKDVKVELSCDISFSPGNVTTIFDNSAFGADKVYVESASGKEIIVRSQVLARYVRFSSNGNSRNSDNHYVQVEVYATPPDILPTNVANGIVTPGVNNAQYITDGISDDSTKYIDLGTGSKSLSFDLGKFCDVSSLKVWHYYADNRIYNDVKFELSLDPCFYFSTVVFDSSSSGKDSKYIETSSGEQVFLDTPIIARYVRLSSNGNSVDANNQYVQVEVYGIPGGIQTGLEAEWDFGYMNVNQNVVDMTDNVGGVKNLVNFSGVSNGQDLPGLMFTNNQYGTLSSLNNTIRSKTWTVSAWIKKSATVATNPVVLMRDSNSANGLELVLQTSNTNPKVGITIPGSASPTAFNYIAPVGIWTNLAFVANSDGANATNISLFANGEYKGTISYPIASIFPLTQIGTSSTANRTSINATLGQIRMFSRVLSQDEILAQLKSNIETQPSINLASGKTFTYLDGNAINGDTYITDGAFDNNTASVGSGLQSIKLDLGAFYDLTSICLCHEATSSKIYQDVKCEVSMDSNFVYSTTVFDNSANGMDAPYTEVPTGEVINFAMPISARYIELSSNGSNIDSNNFYTEVQVFGADGGSLTGLDAYYNMSYGASSAGSDLTGHGYNGTVSGSPSPTADGEGLQFASSGQYISASSTKTYNGPWTVSALIRRDALCSGAQTSVKLMDKIKLDQSGQNEPGYSGTGFDYFLPFNTWVQLTFICEPILDTQGAVSGANVAIYANSNLISTATVTGTIACQLANNILGSLGVSDCLAGFSIGNFQIYERVLTSNEIRMICNDPGIDIAQDKNILAQSGISGGMQGNGQTISGLSLITDGRSYNLQEYADLGDGLQSVVIDLGEVYDVDELRLWHYYADGRIYKDVVVDLSKDADFTEYDTVYNNSVSLYGGDVEYAETTAGKDIVLDTPIKARYVRLWSNGSNVNVYNHYCGVEVFGKISNNMTNNEVAEWNFSEVGARDAIIYDLTGNGNNGTLIGSPQIADDGTGVVFDGDQYVDLSKADIQAPWTAIAWVNVDSNRPSVIFDSSSFSIYLVGSGNSACMEYYDKLASKTYTSNYTVPDDIWTNVTLTAGVDGNDTDIIIYANGKYQDALKIVGENAALPMSKIGTNTPNNYLDSTLGAIKIFSKALSTDEVGALVSVTESSNTSNLILDNVGSVTAAFGLKKLSDAYNSNCIEIRRETDNTTLNIGFVGDSLDINTLKDFMQGGRAYVETWYDQSGNGNDVIQDSSSSQPEIDVSGSDVYLRFGGNGFTGLYNNNPQNMPLSNNTHTVYFNSSIDESNSIRNSVVLWGQAIGSNQDREFCASIPANSYNGQGPGELFNANNVFYNFTPAQNTFNSYAFTYNGDANNTSELYIDGQYLGTSNHSSATDTQNGVLQIGYLDKNGTDFLEGETSEIIIYKRVLSDDEIKEISDDDTAFNLVTESTQGLMANNGDISIPYILDQIPAYEANAINPTVVLSLRKLVGSYNGSCIRVKRSIDSNEADIGFTENGELDKNALLNFVGIGNGYIVKWYDQSGGNYDFVNYQDTGDYSKLPMIVYAGTIMTVNGKPTVNFTGTEYLYVPSATDSTTASATGFPIYQHYFTAYMVCNFTNSNNGNNSILTSNNSSTGFSIMYNSSNTGNQVIVGNSSSQEVVSNDLLYANTLKNIYYERLNEDLKINGSKNYSPTINNTQILDGVSPKYIGITGSTQGLVGNLSELIFINNIYSQNISDTFSYNIYDNISQNINDYYAIDRFDDDVKTVADGVPSQVYGLRRMLGNYTGNCIQVMRSSDNKTQDIGFTEDGSLDVTALIDFVGSTDGYITKLYNQNQWSLDANNLTGLNEKIISNQVLLYDSVNIKVPSVTINGVNYDLGKVDYYKKNSISAIYDPNIVSHNSQNSIQAMYGLRKINNAYTGNAIRVRVGTNEKNIGFVGNDLDINTLSNFIGNGTGYVKTWYDQSGNNRNSSHLSNDTTQPQIVLDSPIGGLPSIYFGGSQNLSLGAIDFTANNGKYSVYTVARFDPNNLGTILGQSNEIIANSLRITMAQHTNNYSYGSNQFTYSSIDLYRGNGTSQGSTNLQNIGSNANYNLFINPNQNYVLGFAQNTSNITAYNSSFAYYLGTNSTTPIDSSKPIYIGSDDSTPSGNEAIMYLSEIIIANNAFSASESKAVQDEQKTYFNIDNIQSLASVPKTVAPSAVSGFTLDKEPNASCAYGMRKIRSDYTGACIRVRRISDNTEMDIGFTGDRLDTKTLASFVGDGQGYVSIWYDQSGNALNAVQIDPNLQPIVNKDTYESVLFNNDMLGFTSQTLTDYSTFITYDVKSFNQNGLNYLLGGASSGFYAGGGLNSYGIGEQSADADASRRVSDRSFTQKETVIFEPDGIYTHTCELTYEPGLNNEVPNITVNTIGNQTSGNSNYSHNGNIYEIIVYPTTLNSVNKQVVLDSMDNKNILDSVTGSIGSYGLRKLNSSYGGPCVKVRRPSDGLIQDIGFDVNGNFSISQFVGFVGGGQTGYIETWYDQSGYNRNAQQQNNNQQPIIKIDPNTNTPNIYYDGLNDSLKISSLNINGAATIFTVCKANDIADRRLYSQLSGDLTQNGSISFGPTSMPRMVGIKGFELGTGYIPVLPATIGNNILGVRYGSNGKAWINAVAGAAFNLDLNAQDIGIGSRFIGADGRAWNGTINEFIVYNSSLSDDLANIVMQNQNDYYSIHKNAATDKVPNTVAAYGLTKLNSNYDGSCINVRYQNLLDANDIKNGIKIDIGFKGTDLDIQMLNAFLGEADGYITEWYDQSGSGIDLSQADTTKQPRLLLKSDDTYTIEFGKGGCSYLSNTTSSKFNLLPLGNAPHTIYVDTRLDDTSDESALVSWGTGATNSMREFTPSYASSNAAGHFWSNNAYFNYLAPIGTDKEFAWDYEALTSKLYVDGILVDTQRHNQEPNTLADNTIGSTVGQLRIGTNSWNEANAYFVGDLSKLIIYNRALTDTEVYGLSTPELLLQDTTPESFMLDDINNNYIFSDNKYDGQYLLDTYTAATAAYGLRRLRSDYFGPAVRVRRSNDNQLMDIYFDSDTESLDTDTLTSFLNGSVGYVVTWYDQSGLGNDAIQTNVSQQPQILAQSPLYNRPSVYFYDPNTNNCLQINNNSNFSLAGNVSLFTIIRPQQKSHTGENGILSQTQVGSSLPCSIDVYFEDPNNNPFGVLRGNGSGNYSYAYNQLPTGTETDFMLSVTTDNTNVNIYSNGVKTISNYTNGSNATIADSSPKAPIYIGNRGDNCTAAHMYMSELILADGLASDSDVDYIYYNQKDYFINNPQAKFNQDIYSGPVAAYGLRKLRADYNGPAIRVRRDDNNVEKDIYFNSSDGSLDSNGLSCFLDGNQGYVTTWYDQSGNGSTAVQTDTSKQPEIILQSPINNDAAVYFDDPNARKSLIIKQNDFSLACDFSLFTLINKNRPDGSGSIIGQTKANIANPTDIYWNASPNSNIVVNRGTGSGYFDSNSSTNFLNNINYSIGIIADTIGTQIYSNKTKENATPYVNNTYSIADANPKDTLYIGDRGDGNFAAQMYMTELVLYDKAVSKSKAGYINNNMIQYYINNVAPQTSYCKSPTELAFSLRKLNDNYIGPCIRVRRDLNLNDGESSEKDIGFDNLGVLNTDTLAKFVGYGNGYVVRWYDQSGRGNNAIQTDPDHQPQIVVNGQILKCNGKPLMHFDGNRWFVTNYNTNLSLSFNSNNSFSTIVVGKAYDTTGAFIGAYTDASDNWALQDGMIIRSNIDTSNNAVSYPISYKPANNYAVYNAKEVSQLSGIQSGGQIKVNGVMRGTGTALNNIGVSNLIIGSDSVSTGALFGDILEVIVLSSNSDDLGSNLEQSAMDYYEIAGGALMVNPVSGITPTADFSLRRLSAAYTGSCIRVRRSTDGLELDIGFEGDSLDTQAILDFVGTGDGYVSRWYDQSGNMQDAIQTNEMLQPQIASFGAIIMEKGKPAMQYNGNSWMQGTLVSSQSGPMTINTVAMDEYQMKKADLNASYDATMGGIFNMLTGGEGLFCQGGYQYVLNSQMPGTNDTIAAGTKHPVASSLSVITGIYPDPDDNANSSIYLNSSLEETYTGASQPIALDDIFRIGIAGNNQNNTFVGKIFEIITSNTSVTSQVQQALEAAQMNYYGMIQNPTAGF